MFKNTQEVNTENKVRKTVREMSTCYIVYIIGPSVGVLRKTSESIKKRNFFIV
jgi:hypothetical protein